MRLLTAVLLSLCMLAGCTATDPNKVTPTKRMDGDTSCKNSSGERVSCPEKKVN
jgi:uncharacterized protein YcfL